MVSTCPNQKFSSDEFSEEELTTITHPMRVMTAEEETTIKQMLGEAMQTPPTLFSGPTVATVLCLSTNLRSIVATKVSKSVFNGVSHLAFIGS